MKKNGKKKPSVKVNDMRAKKNPKGGSIIIKDAIVTSRLDKTTPLATSRTDDKYPTTLANKTIKIS